MLLRDELCTLPTLAYMKCLGLIVVIVVCGNCSGSRIRDLNTSKAKLRGAKDPREKI